MFFFLLPFFKWFPCSFFFPIPNLIIWLIIATKLWLILILFLTEVSKKGKPFSWAKFCPSSKETCLKSSQSHLLPTKTKQVLFISIFSLIPFNQVLIFLKLSLFVKSWDCLINLGEILKKYNIVKEYYYENEKEKVGSVVHFTIENKEKSEEGSFKIVKIEKNINKEKWILVFCPLELKYYVQEMEFVLYKLEDNNTFIYINHKFKELLPHETMKELQFKKRFLFDMIKKELEGKEF